MAMTPITVRPTRADLSVAKIISAHTGPRTERAAAFLTWGADEHILCALAAGWWLYCRGKNANARRASDHILQGWRRAAFRVRSAIRKRTRVEAIMVLILVGAAELCRKRAGRKFLEAGPYAWLIL